MFRNGITLCTLGSIYQSFRIRYAEDNLRQMITYQYFLVDEGSQVSDADLFPLLNSISLASQEH